MRKLNELSAQCSWWQISLRTALSGTSLSFFITTIPRHISYLRSAWWASLATWIPITIVLSFAISLVSTSEIQFLYQSLQYYCSNKSSSLEEELGQYHWLKWLIFHWLWQVHTYYTYYTTSCSVADQYKRARDNKIIPLIFTNKWQKRVETQRP